MTFQIFKELTLIHSLMSGVRDLLGGLLVPFERQFRAHLPNTDGPGTGVRTGDRGSQSAVPGTEAGPTTPGLH